jgi:hypothetical protein
MYEVLLLSGLIKTVETLIGGPGKGKKGRGVAASDKSSLVIGAVAVLIFKTKAEKKKERAGRIRLDII